MGTHTADDEGSEQRDHVRGSALLVLGRVLAMFIGMATTVVIVRTLTKADYGAFEFALTLASAGRILLSLGQGRLLSRFMAAYEEQQDYPRMFGAMFLAAGTIVLTSIPAIIIFFVFGDELFGSTLQGDIGVRVVLILIFAAPMEALDQVFVSLFAVFSKPRAIFFRKHLLAPGLRLVVVLLLALTDSGVLFLAVGYVVASLAGLLLYVGLLWGALKERGLLKEFNPRKVILPYRAVFEFSLPLVTGELTLLSLKMGGVMVLALYHPITEVADYRVVFGTARLNTAITASFATLFLPTIARFHARGDLAGLRHSYWHTAAFIAVFSFPIFALTGPLAPATTLTLFGERYAGSAVILSILSVGYYFNVVLGFNVYALQVAGRIRFLVVVNLAIAVLNLALCFALAPQFGGVGVALANCAALCAQNIVNQWMLRRTIDTGFVGRECWSCYTLIAGATGGLWVLQVLFTPGLLASVVLGAVASLLVLAGSQRALRFGDTFPELRRIPLLGRLVR
jgi:O-antigen/teichoic acid export membrane protein